MSRTRDCTNDPTIAAASGQKSIWIAGLLVAVLLLSSVLLVRWLQAQTYSSTSFRASWRGDSLAIHSGRGPALLTHIVGVSEGAPVAAQLPTPVLMLDSAGTTVDARTLSSLQWRNDGGSPQKAPPVGSAVRVLFVPLVSSR